MRFNQMTMTYGNKEIFSQFSMHLTPNEITCVMGASGVGKTTLLRLAARLIDPTSGRIDQLDGRVSYVFQESRLLPWLTVIENVLWPLKKEERANARSRAETMLHQMGLREATSLFPDQLSGGMKQRVSLARAFIVQPNLLLMDEPFQSLDHQTKESMYGLLSDLWELYRPTILLVTHDLHEANTLGHHIVHLDGRPVTTATDLTDQL